MSGVANQAPDPALQLFHRGPAALLTITEHGVILHHNDRLRRWLGKPGNAPDLRGRNITEWLAPASRLLYETQILPRLLATGTAREIVLDIRDDCGNRSPILCNADRGVAPDGSRVIYVAAVAAPGRIEFERDLVAAHHATSLAHERLTVLLEATSRLAVARGIDDLGTALLSAAGRASRATWTEVRLFASSELREDRAWGSPPPGIQQLDNRAGTGARAVQLVYRDAASLSELPSPEAEPLHQAGVAALIVTPILAPGSSDTPLGEIRCWFGRPRSLDDDELETLRALATQAERVFEHLGLQDQLRHRAMHDGLTGLPNRAMFEERLRVQLDQAEQTGAPCAVIFIDLDGFKAINDDLGHAEGDATLREVADRLRRVCRSGDTVSRFGGDEFVIAISRVTRPVVSELANRLLAAVRSPLSAQRSSFPLSSSIGVMHWDPRATHRPPTTAEIIDGADAAMYWAKRAGKDTVILRSWKPDSV